MSVHWRCFSVVAWLACVGASSCAPRAVEVDATAIVQEGRVVAETQCGGCHAPGSTGLSPRNDAPPLRTLFTHYRADTLTEEFIAGIKVGHPDMPLFEMNPQGVDSLVAYLKSIQEPSRRDGAVDHR